MAIVSRIEDLQILLTVVDSGSLSLAAKVLDIQVAKVSRALSRLEQELDCTLLNRTTRKLELTEEGRVFINAVRGGLDQLAQAEEQLRLLKGTPTGRLRVDAATPFILHQLVPLVAGFRQCYPQIQLELVANENIIDLIERRTDLAIRIGALQDSNLHARLLGRSPLHLVAAPAYLERFGVPTSLGELAQHQLLGFSDAPHLNRWPLTAPFTFTPVLASSSGEALRQLCLAGHGVTLLSEFMIGDDLRCGRLVKILAESVRSPNDRELVHGVYYRNTALSSRIKAFLHYIAPRLQLRQQA
ncbi:LysR family transcriptional regulator [Balneatrix alpica]|uniref:LysR family transcriptional regulator n=1 Tax=Balneatrix alpica TaxID=75684 RepID=UPI00048739F4